MKDGEAVRTATIADRAHDRTRAARFSGMVQGSLFGDYVALAKPEITFLVSLSAVAGFALGSSGPMDLTLLCTAVVGIVLTSGGSGALNHYLEREQDAVMKRTAQRPLPSGRIPALHVRNFGVLLTGAGLGILCPLVNPLTAVLAAVTVILYLFVYTPLKRKTWLNTIVGTIPGALPVVGGYAAATNSAAGASAWLLFCLLAFWQMPHFLSLAWMYRKDYSRGGFEMLPARDRSGTRTVFQTAVFTVAMVATSLLLAWYEGMGILYVGLALFAAALMLRPVVAFARSRSNTDARRVLKASVVYVPVIVFAILIDRLV